MTIKLHDTQKSWLSVSVQYMRAIVNKNINNNVLMNKNEARIPFEGINDRTWRLSVGNILVDTWATVMRLSIFCGSGLESLLGKQVWTGVEGESNPS